MNARQAIDLQVGDRVPELHGGPITDLHLQDDGDVVIGFDGIEFYVDPTDMLDVVR